MNGPLERGRGDAERQLGTSPEERDAGVDVGDVVEPPGTEPHRAPGVDRLAGRDGVARSLEQVLEHGGRETFAGALLQTGEPARLRRHRTSTPAKLFLPRRSTSSRSSIRSASDGT